MKKVHIRVRHIGELINQLPYGQPLFKNSYAEPNKELIYSPIEAYRTT